MLKWNFLYFSLCPFSHVLSLDTTEETSSTFFTPSHSVFLNVDKSL